MNVLGLMLSLTCLMVITGYIYSEIHTDRFIPHLDRLFLTTFEQESIQEVKMPSRVFDFGSGSGGFKDITQDAAIEAISNLVILGQNPVEIEHSKDPVIADVVIAEKSFFQLVPYPLGKGNPDISSPDAAFLTESFVKRIFQDKNPLGETIRLASGSLYTVSGIIDDHSIKSSISFDILLASPQERLPMNYKGQQLTLVLLHPGSDYKIINDKYGFFQGEKDYIIYRYQLFPFKEFYFDRTLTQGSSFKQGNYESILILIAAVGVILMIGISNFINLFTLVVLQRGKEIGIKKVLGVGKKDLFLELWIENIFLITIALLGSVLLAHTLSPVLFTYLGINQMYSWKFTVVLAGGFLLILPVLTTLYPYFKYSKSTPVTSIGTISKIKTTPLVRTLILGFQYFLAILLLTVSLFFVKQFFFITKADPGYRTGNVMITTFDPENNEASVSVKKVLEQKIKSSPLFEGISYGLPPSQIRAGNFEVRTQGSEEYRKTSLVPVTLDWVRLFNIQLVDGEWWENDPESYEPDLIVSESALKLLGITDYKEAVLETDLMKLASAEGGDLIYTDGFRFRIKGVIRDFHVQGWNNKAYPAILFLSNGTIGSSSSLILSIVSGKEKEALAFLQKEYGDLMGQELPYYFFLEDDMEKMYGEEKKLAVLFSGFTLVAILISMLGLFGISLFDIQLQHKTIAIRRVHGAPLSLIIKLLMKRYLLVLILSFLLTLPFTFFIVISYLQNFAIQTPLSVWVFIAAFAFTLVVSLCTIAWQVYRAARENPQKILKSE